MSQIALNTLVADYLDTGRSSELNVLEKAARKNRPLKDRAHIMIAFAKARIANPPFRRRCGLS